MASLKSASRQGSRCVPELGSDSGPEDKTWGALLAATLKLYARAKPIEFGFDIGVDLDSEDAQ